MTHDVIHKYKCDLECKSFKNKEPNSRHYLMQYRDHHTTGDVRSEEDEERICETDISSMP